MLKCFHTLSRSFSPSQFSFNIENKANNEMSLANIRAHIIFVYLSLYIYFKYNINNLACRLFSYVAGAEGDLTYKVSECEYEFEYEYNHADIVYVYAAHAKSHHSSTHTHSHTHTYAQQTRLIFT